MQKQIPKGWRETSVDNVADIYLGGTPARKTKKFWNGDVKWLAIQDIVNSEGRYVSDSEETITQLGVESSAAKVLPKDTLVISARGTVGEMAILAEAMAFNQSCYGLLSKNSKKFDQLYLYYSLKEAVNRAKKLAHGGVFNTITKDTFNYLHIKFPKDSSVQKRIVSILSAFDDKIEVNNKIAKTLEEMAQAIYKEWFLDSKGKEISISDLADYINGGAFGKIVNHNNSGLPLIKIAELNSGIGDRTEWINEDVDSKYYINDGDLLFSWSGSLDLFIWDKGKAVLNQHIFNVKPKKDFTRGLLYFVLQSKLPYFQHLAGAKATTMGHIKKEHLKEQTIKIPDNHDLSTFEVYYKKLVQLKLENQKLTEMRDLLLPKLMKGEITV